MLVTYSVNTAIDELDFSTIDGDISIRDAIAAAVSGDTINFDASTMNGATITLDAAKGQIVIDGESLAIDGRDSNGVPLGITIDANDPSMEGHTGEGIRVFNILDPTGGANPPVTLIGLTLKGGDVGGFSGQGGAIRSEARLVLRDCTITSNEADFGGAIYIQVPGDETSREVLLIEDSVIHQNDAINGAGVVIVSGDALEPTTDTIVITRTTFSQNMSGGDGGGVYAELYGASMTIADSPFVLNESFGNGGGVYALLNNDASLTVIGSQMEQNNGGFLGAGMYAEVNSESTLSLEASFFDRNQATSHGGGVYADVSGATVEVIRSDFRENEAGQFGGVGGGMFAQASNGSNLTIDETSFELNTANNDGGGLYLDVSSSSARIDESSFVDNHALHFSGGGIHVRLANDASAEIVNSNININDAVSGGGGVYGLILPDATLEIRDSVITGNIATDGGGVRVDMAGFGHTQANGSVFNLERSRVNGNEAFNRGGGILTAIGSGGKATVTESVVTENKAGIARSFTGDIPNAGGGMYAFLWTDTAAATLTITGSEFSNNRAGEHGGGLALCTKRTGTAPSHIKTQLSIYNTMISGNQVLPSMDGQPPGTGGGVHLAFYKLDGQKLDARFQNTTITNNTADQGGGVWTYTPTEDSEMDVRLTNSIASANKNHSEGANNLYGSFNIVETIYNLIGQNGNLVWDPDGDPASLSGQNIFDDDPKLEPLAWNGGPTQTHRPKSDSDAIDRGLDILAVIPFTSTRLSTDQRGEGFIRPYDVPGIPNPPDPARTVDIGAYEVSLAKVIDVVLDRLGWAESAKYSYAEVVAAGDQLRPVYLQNANRIEIHFDGPVDLTNSKLEILGNQRAVVKTTDGGQNATITRLTSSDPTVGIWELTSGAVFGNGKYALQLSGVTGSGGALLDGDWTDLPVQVANRLRPDDYGDDTGSPLVSGNDMPEGFFEFHFAVLPGDYNQDGMVDESDDELETVKDGNGNGIIEAGTSGADTVVASSNVGSRLPFRTNNGDYEDDDNVDGSPTNQWMFDYVVWRSQYLSSGLNLEADGNESGTVDAGDYIVWRENAPSHSAWYLGPTGAGAALALVDMENSPQVVDVIVSGSDSAHAPFSFATVDGSGEQLRTVPVGRIDTISITFSEDVNVVASNLTFVGLHTANRPELVEFDYDLATMTATWRFELVLTGSTYGPPYEPILADHYAIVLSDAVTDIEGNRLDGEWTNPASLTTTNPGVSEFPSGDGNPGGNFVFIATIYQGDFDQNNLLDYSDLMVAWMNAGQIFAGAEFDDGDFDGDGDVDQTDVDMWYEAHHMPYDLRNVQVLADLDGDFDVDNDDVDWLVDRLGMSNPTWTDGDLNGDGAVNNLDVDLAFAQYGVHLEVAA